MSYEGFPNRENPSYGKVASESSRTFVRSLSSTTTTVQRTRTFLFGVVVDAAWFAGRYVLLLFYKVSLLSFYCSWCPNVTLDAT